MIDGSITISRVYTSTNADYVSISLRDNASAREFVEVRMDLDDFAAAVLGLGQTPVQFTLRGADKVGWTMEPCRIFLNIHSRDEWEERYAALCDEYEGKGYEVMRDRQWNQQRLTSDGYVLFCRTYREP